MDVTRLEQRAYIKIAVLRGRKARECHSLLVEVVGNNAPLNVSSVAFLPRSTAVLVESHTFCTTLDLQLSFYGPLCYNCRAHCLLLQCLRTMNVILAGAHYYFMVSSLYI